MAENSKIEWTDHTFNPWTGCTKVGPGCDHCYAEAWAKRSGAVKWGAGEPRRRTTPANWLLLTKRIGNAADMMRDASSRWRDPGSLPLPNVWIGATVVNQAEADRDIPKLLAVPARVRFLSIEPMLGPINLADMEAEGDDAYVDPLTEWTAAEMTEMWGEPMPEHHRIDWVICGGESGPGARPMHPDWPRSLRDQCADAGVPFFFKQWGEWTDVDNGPADDESYEGKAGCWVHADGGSHDGALGVEFFGEHPMYRVGKKAAGRLLDGRVHDGFPNDAKETA